MSRLLVGLIGQAGSGKSALARHLVTRHGFVRMRFAENLKTMLRIGLGLTEEQIDGDAKMVPLADYGGRTPRELMQTLGTEWGRRLVHPDVWVIAWRRSLPATGLVCVDDVRFPNEAAAIRAEGGLLWRITRPANPTAPQDHPSERLQREILADLEIANTADLAALRAKVDGVVEPLLPITARSA